jgi:hypothetical protein
MGEKKRKQGIQLEDPPQGITPNPLALLAA